MKRVFLGGTCNGSTWRDKIIEHLKIDYFNPVVENWNDEAKENEIIERQICDFCLYVITPKMTGVYSIAEVVDDSNKRPDKTIMVIYDNDEGAMFTDAQLAPLFAVATIVRANGCIVSRSLIATAAYLNNRRIP